MPEGLSPQEVGKEIAEHAEQEGDGETQERWDRLVSIAEAVLLSIVALTAALVWLRGCEVEHGVAREPSGGLDGEDQGEPGESSGCRPKKL